MTISVPGPHWSDLIYEIAAWFERIGEIADPTRPGGRASPPLSGTPSPPSSNGVMRTDGREDRKRTRVRFAYPVKKGDINWKKLESAVLGEDLEGVPEGQDRGSDCSVFGNHGGAGRESQVSGKGNVITSMRC